MAATGLLQAWSGATLMLCMGKQLVHATISTTFIVLIWHIENCAYHVIMLVVMWSMLGLSDQTSVWYHTHTQEHPGLIRISTYWYLDGFRTQCHVQGCPHVLCST